MGKQAIENGNVLEGPVTLVENENGRPILLPFNGVEDGLVLLFTNHEEMGIRIPPRGNGVRVIARGNHTKPYGYYGGWSWQEILMILEPGAELSVKHRGKAKFGFQWETLHWDGQSFQRGIPEQFHPPSDLPLAGAEEL